jgi:hypothetical protein
MSKRQQKRLETGTRRAKTRELDSDFRWEDWPTKGTNPNTKTGAPDPDGGQPVPIPPSKPPQAPMQPMEELPREYTKQGGAADIILALQSLRKRKAIDADVTVVRKVGSEYRYHQVEPLLSQCSTLLDRCLASRSEWQALGEKSFAQWLELVQFGELDGIHKEETAYGYYFTAWSDAAREAYAQACTSLAQNGSSEALSRLLKPTTNKPAGPDNLPSNQLAEFAEMSSVAGESDAAELRYIAARARAEFENSNIDFRRRRTESARRANATKALAFTETGGPYNYEERRTAVQERFLADLKGAQDRLAAIRVGMKTIYGYDLPIATQPDVFNSTLISVRNALDWLARFSALDQNYVLPVSIKCLVGSSWAKGLRSDGRAGSWEFVMPETLFPKQAHVRLRGVSAAVDIANTRDIFQLALRVPENARVSFLDGSQRSIPQDVPITRICRIQGRGSPTPPDVMGVLSLHNVSPISVQGSSWRLVITSQMVPPDITDDLSKQTPDLRTTFIGSSDRLEDILLFLHLAVRAVPNNGGRRRSAAQYNGPRARNGAIDHHESATSGL